MAHFYSPLPDPEDIRRRRGEILDRSAPSVISSVRADKLRAIVDKINADVREVLSTEESKAFFSARRSGPRSSKAPEPA